MKFRASMMAVLIGLAGAPVVAMDDQDAAFDKRDNVVTNSFGNCVRTKWEAQGDVCAPAKPKPAPVVVPKPVPVPKQTIGREHRTVYFDFNDATLNDDAKQKLDRLIGHVANSKRINGAGIAGFADRIGSEDYNFELSKERAKVVYGYLNNRVRINTQILDIRAFGEKSAKSECSDNLSREQKIACLAKDRRVEVIFEYVE